MFRRIAFLFTFKYLYYIAYLYFTFFRSYFMLAVENMSKVYKKKTYG